MLARKKNKVYKVTEANRKSYQDSGFDIYSDEGELIAYGRGKTVPYETYAALKAENEAAKAEISALEEAAVESAESAETAEIAAETADSDAAEDTAAAKTKTTKSSAKSRKTGE